MKWQILVAALAVVLVQLAPLPAWSHHHWGYGGGWGNGCYHHHWNNGWGNGYGWGNNYGYGNMYRPNMGYGYGGGYPSYGGYGYGGYPGMFGGMSRFMRGF